MRLELADKGKILGIISKGGEEPISCSGPLPGQIYNSFLQHEV